MNDRVRAGMSAVMDSSLVNVFDRSSAARLANQLGFGDVADWIRTCTAKEYVETLRQARKNPDK